MSESQEAGLRISSVKSLEAVDSLGRRRGCRERGSYRGLYPPLGAAGSLTKLHVEIAVGDPPGGP